MRARVRALAIPAVVVTFAGLPVVALATLAADASAQGTDYVRAHYTKYEYRILMRDGVRLFTSVYVPKDAGGEKRYPILLTRTPYGVSPYGSDAYRDGVGPSEAAGKEGFICAYQDVRGRFLSEGQFEDMRPYKENKSPKETDESSDTWDTIDWLVKHVRWNNGRVGMWGISYPGFYTSMGIIDAHPALVAASPQAPIADWFVGDDFHHNGALFLPHAFNFLASFGKPRPEPTTKRAPSFDHGTLDGYRFFLEAGPMPYYDRKYLKGEVAFWREAMAHETYDEFWQARNIRPHLKGVKPAVLTVGGWFDAEDLFGALETYRSIERQSPGIANRLVMGPWPHGGWSWGIGEALGKVRFGQATAKFFQEEIELPFFRYYLKGGDDPKLPEAYVFETGCDTWRALDAWPPKEAKPVDFYLSAKGRLSREASGETGDAFDEYVSDPAKPVPFIEDVSASMTREYMVDDQRHASRRPDVLVYQTEPLASDTTVAGPILASLNVSTTGTDSDWVVKVIDVYPDDYPVQPGEWTKQAPWDEPPAHSKMGGYQQLVRGEPFRGKFRKSFEKPEPFVPGQVEKVEFTMPDVFHTFRRGHQIMVQVQSSWFPLVNLNPQTFVDINTASEADFRKATQRVWRTAVRPSFVRLGVVSD
jgi:putative CocE/NonD family hydrolase